MREDIVVKQARRGDKGAFGRLFERYEKPVFNLALRMLNDSDEAKDVLQETFIKAFRKLEDFRETSKFSTWLYRIAMNECLMRIRKRIRSHTVSMDEPLSGEEGEVMPQYADSDAKNPLTHMEKKEAQEFIRRVLNEMEPPLRSALILRDIEGLTAEEAGMALGITVPALKSRLHRARLFLRKRLLHYFAEYGA